MSKEQTLQHIALVQKLIGNAVTRLVVRAIVHDKSKLESPEVEVFEEFTPKLAGSTYGSEEYEEFRKAMKPALDHHYAHNSHHPEHYPNGIRGMSLLDLLEMICDWKAATMRHNDGDILRSVEINQKRFGYSDELKEIFLNTVKEMGFAYTDGSAITPPTGHENGNCDLRQRHEEEGDRAGHRPVQPEVRS